MSTKIYGIKNCDTVKKARKWLENQQVDYQFHDFREDGLSKAKIQQWLKSVDWEVLVNKRSTTWKQLDENTRNNLNKTSAIATMLESPTLIKRPVLEHNNTVQVGFGDKQYSEIFQ